MTFFKGITNPCTHLHPPPPSSFQPTPSFIHLHPTLCNTLNFLEPQYHMQLSNFPKFRLKNSKLSISIENWYTAILEELIPNPHLHFWNSNLKIQFCANLDPKRQNNHVYDFTFLQSLTLFQFGALVYLMLYLCFESF